MRLLPRDEKFFDLFTAVATFTVEAARLQQELLRVDANRRGAIVDQIKRLEHQADQSPTRLSPGSTGFSSPRSTGRTSTSWPPGWTTSST